MNIEYCHYTKLEIENGKYCNDFDNKKLKNMILNNKTYEIKKIVHENFQFSKMLLNDFKNFKEIEQYNKNYECSYNFNEIENKNVYNVHFINNEHEHFHGNNIIFEQLPTKKFYYDYLENIEKIILNIVHVLKNKVTYEKHLKLLYEIEYFLRKMDFSENVYYNYRYSFEKSNNDNYSFKNYLLEKYLIKNFSEIDYNIKNTYKILKYSYDKILKILYNIIEKNNFKGVNFDFEHF